VFNSPALDELVRRIDSVFAGRPEDYEIIFIDDCSTDARVWPKLLELTEQHPGVRALQLSKNFGQHAATLCGLKHSRGDFVITMDDDLEHRPEEIPKFLSAADYDVVVAQFRHRNHSLFRRIASKIKGVFDRVIVGKPKDIQLSSYRMLSRVVVEGMLSINTPHPFLPALMFHVSDSVTGVDIEYGRRDEGTSGYTLRKLLRLFTDLLVNNSSLVLRLVGSVGIVLAAASFILALYFTYKKLTHGIAITGWTSLFATTLLIGGLLLFSIAVVGEYLIRIIEASEARPTYFVRRRAGLACEAAAEPAGFDRDLGAAERKTRHGEQSLGQF
jgi:glycosyltransferase involved in cell wall biosynthesis